GTLGTNYVAKWNGTTLANSTIFDNGNVGIGTPTPGQKLTVVGKAAIGQFINGTAVIDAHDGNAYYGTNTAENGIAINAAGNVGIGTSTPTYKLEVAGNVGANAFYYRSDRSLKKDITTIQDALTKINLLNGYAFTWKSDDRKDLGVVAQEVENVFPELVHTDISGLKSVEYANLVAPLIEAVKTLTLQNKQLESRITQLEARIK
ncbi:TPA: hypothetical protein DEP21_00210, partial [Patescibacteria group bacterium]|nr:hypothetical protein [Candidatus Gracilibacteria bacterium]